LSLGFWLIRGIALGPIGGLSARQFNSCLPRGEERAKQRVMDHISRFPTVESHYCRVSSLRQYLEAGLSLSQMHRLYVDEVAMTGEKTVQEHVYRKIFNDKKYVLSN